MYVSRYDSPIGKLLLTCNDRGLTGLYMNREVTRQEDHPVFQETVAWLDAYFRGECPPVTVPLALEGTPFQRIVWTILQTIPYGETRSYGSIAKEVAAVLGKDKMSAQAVGQAVGKNPISILIPCHRVVGAKGQLTGYAGGLDKKIWLLRHERGEEI
jgi:methylated-DNA-[protein]-cysteine S-methyltransferase